MSAKTIFCTLVILFGAQTLLAKASVNEQTVYYDVCRKGFMAQGKQLQRVSAYSYIDCAARCSKEEECAGANVCLLETSGLIDCRLINQITPGFCKNLIPTISPLCFYIPKAARDQQLKPSPPVTCSNGGTPSDNGCRCPLQYTGSTCERLFRDCSEIYENSYQQDGQTGVYDIQPMTSQQPFKVFCEFNDEGITYPLKQKLEDLDQNCASCRQGFGDDLGVRPNSIDYFVGLENLHHLLRQASYGLEIAIQYGSNFIQASSIYDNFTIGPESEKYALRYSQFDRRSSADNGFSAVFPVTFSCNGPPKYGGCYDDQQETGWYGADCSGYGLFGKNDHIPWEVKGDKIEVRVIELKLFRQSDYYDN